MEKDLFELCERNSGLALEVRHNSTDDWTVRVYDKRGRVIGDWGEPVVFAQEGFREMTFAQAYIELSKYLLDTQGRL